MTPPPRRRRRLLPVVFYAHPFEIALGLILVINGLRALASGDTSPAVDDLPEVPLLLYRLVSLIGGVAALIGLAYRQHIAGRTLERSAMYLVAASYLAYGVLIFGTYGITVGAASGTITLLVGAACLLRASAIRHTERVILEQLRAANRDAAALRQLVDGRPPRSPEEDAQEERHE